jgi:HPt (histidine-containing phosphotransfer) domain-containing protein
MNSPELGYLRNVHKGIIESLLNATNNVEQKKYDAALKDCRKVSGALYLARFEGVGRVMDEAIQFILAVQKNDFENRVGEPVNVLKKAFESVRQYILDALADAPDVPMKLWDSYRLLKVGHRSMAHPSQLFFPEMAIEGWSVTNQNQTLEARKIQELRTAFATYLVPWVKDQTQVKTLDGAKRILQLVIKDLPLTAGYIGFFTAAVASLEVVALKEKPDPFDKMVLAKIDQELKSVGEGKSLPERETWRFMLYLVAFSNLNSEAAEKVREKHHLKAYVNLIREEATRHGRTLDDQALTPIKEALSNTKDAWVKVTQGFGGASEMEKPVTLLSERLREFNHPAIQKLGEALVQITNGLKNGRIALNDMLSEEIASMLMLVEQAIEAKGRVSAKYEGRVVGQIHRTLAAVKGNTEQLSAMPESAVDEEYIKRNQRVLKSHVLNEIKGELQAAEEALDGWFRQEDQEGREDVITAVRPLKRLSPVMRMSRLEEAADVLDQVLVGLEILLGKNKTTHNEVERVNVSSKLAALALYLNAEISEQADAKKFLGVEVEQKQRIYSTETVEQKPAKVLAQKKEEPLQIVQAAKTMSAQKASKTEEREYEGFDRVSDLDMLEVYLEDFNDQLTTMKQGSMLLARDLKNKEALSDVRRAFHTLKGSGRMVKGLDRLPNVSEKIELFLKKWIGEERAATQQLASAIDESINLFESWRDELARNKGVDIHSAELLQKFDPSFYPEYAEVSMPVVEVTPEVKPEKEESKNVFVGDIMVERELYHMYIKEAKECVGLMVSEWVKACDEQTKKASKALMGAGHKLGSSSRTLGFGELAEVSYLIERWSERHLDGGGWISEKEAEDVSALIGHAEELFESVKEKEKLVLRRDVVSAVESHIEALRHKPQPVVEVAAPAWAQTSAGGVDKETQDKLKEMLIEEIKTTRAHLGKLEAMLMLVSKDEE